LNRKLVLNNSSYLNEILPCAGFCDVMASASTLKSRRAMAAVISTIYNSVKHTESVGGAATENIALLQLCSARGLCAQLLLAAAPTTHKLLETSTASSSSSSSSSSSGSSSNRLQSKSSDTQNTPAPSDPVLEWLHILFFHILKSDRNSLLRMFLTLKPRAPGENVWDFKVDASIGESSSSKDFNWVSSGDDSMTDVNRPVLTHEQVSAHSVSCI
jgi:hypothetical protein